MEKQSTSEDTVGLFRWSFSKRSSKDKKMSDAPASDGIEEIPVESPEEPQPTEPETPRPKPKPKARGQRGPDKKPRAKPRPKAALAWPEESNQDEESNQESEEILQELDAARLIRSIRTYNQDRHIRKQQMYASWFGR